MFWIVELFIWVLILFSVSGLIMFAKYSYKKQFNTYQIFLPDVDGLIDGSPVRFMGIQIGYVNQIDIVGEDVYVKFIVTDPQVKLEGGTVATVEFSGLGGSKSLELYPPTVFSKNASKLIVAQSPKRIHDSLGLLSQMFEKIVNITYTCSRFMDKVGLIKSSEAGTKNRGMNAANDFLDSSNTWIDNAQIKTKSFKDKINHKNNKDGKHE